MAPKSASVAFSRHVSAPPKLFIPYLAVHCSVTNWSPCHVAAAHPTKPPRRTAGPWRGHSQPSDRPIGSTWRFVTSTPTCGACSPQLPGASSRPTVNRRRRGHVPSHGALRPRTPNTVTVQSDLSVRRSSTPLVTWPLLLAPQPEKIVGAPGPQ